MNNSDHIKSLGIPEGYFDDLKTAIHREIEISDAEETIAGYYKQSLGLTVPEGYFSEVKPLLKNSTAPVRTLNTFSRNWIGAAAAVAAIAMLTVMFISESAPNELAKEQSFDELLAETPISEGYFAYLEYDDLEELSLDKTVETQLDQSTIEYILEDEELLELLTEEYLEF